MDKKKITSREAAQRKQRAREWREFRKAHLLTQVGLASLLGISRREVQFIEAAGITPGFTVLGRFRALKMKHQK